MRVCVCALCACTLPEVGDLLLSMSTDCWLSDSSVRPDGGDRGAGKRSRKGTPSDHFKFVFVVHKHITEVSSVIVSHL